VAPPQLELPVEIEESILDKAHTVKKFPQLEEGIKNVEIIYVTRTQEERFPSPKDADKYRGLFRLNQSIYTEHCAPNTVIMHPLPRDSRTAAQELDIDMNENPNLAIFRQADNGVVIRMALFALVLDVAKEAHDHSKPVTWFNSKGDSKS
jgi:aspartate carbamoyltransferase catalytic subunit